MTEIYLEFKQIGAITKVIAVDAETGTEVSFQAPTNTPLEVLKRIASQKLAYTKSQIKSD